MEIVTDGRRSGLSPASASLAGPARRTLFEKRRETFLEILRGADLRALRGGQFDFAIDFRGGKIAEQFLCHPQAGRAALEQGSGKDLSSDHQFLRGNDLRDEAEAMRFGGLDGSAGEEQIASVLFADLAHQKNGNDGGQKADAHFRVTKLCFGYGDGEIAQRGEAAASRDGVPVYGGDGRHRKIPDSQAEARQAVGVFALLGGGLLGESF